MTLQSEVIDLIQKKLGILEGEIFTITSKGWDSLNYYFKDSKLYDAKPDKETDDWKLIIENFERMKFDVPEYRPKLNDRYFYVYFRRKSLNELTSNFDNNYTIGVVCSSFSGDMIDLLNFKIGNCFMREEEAFKNINKIKHILFNQEHEL